MARRNMRVKVESSDRFFGTGVHAPSHVNVKENSLATTAAALSDFLKVGGNALAAKGAADFDRTAAEAQAAKATGKDRDVLNKSIGYNTAWDRLDAEDDFNLFKAEFGEQLRGADAENMEEEDVQGLFDSASNKAFNMADQSPAYTKVLAPLLLDYNAEVVGIHRDAVIKEIKATQAAKLNRNLTARFDKTGVFDYDMLAQMTSDLYEGKERNTAYETTLVDFAIRNGMPNVLRNAPQKYPSGQPSPLTYGAGLARLRTAIQQAENVKQARITKETKANEKAIKDGNNSAMIVAVQAMAAGDPNSEKLILGFSNRDGASAKDYLQLQSAFRSIRDDVQQQNADENELALLTTEVYSGGAGLRQIQQARADGTFGNGLEGVKRMAQLMSVWERVNDQASQLTRIHKTHLDDLKARYNPSVNGMMGKLDQRRAGLQANALLDYRTAVFESKEDPDKAWTRIREQGDATLERFGEINVMGHPDDNLPPADVANLWLNNQMTDSRIRSYRFTVDQIEGLGLDADDELRLLNTIF